MAHITVQLICYKLGEGWAKMADAAASWYDKVDWDDHVLDILLFGWIGWAVFLYFTLNSIGSLIGPLQRVQPVDRLLPASTHAVTAAHHTGKESCLWLNTALNWFYLHYYHPPEFIDVWVQSLNDQVQKLGGPVQIKFERIHQGSLPPKFSDVLYEAAPEDKYTITCHLESRDLAFDVFASQQTHEGVKLTNCTATVLRMKGTLQVSSFKEGLNVKIRAAFMGKPEIKLKLQPSNPYQDPEDLVDLGAVESVIRNAIALATTTIDITHLLMPDGYVPSPVRDRPGSGRGGGSMRSGGGDAFQFQPPPNHSPRPPFDQQKQHGQQSQQGQQGQGQGRGMGKVDASPLQAMSAPKTAASAKPLPPSQTLFEPIEASEYPSAFSAPSYSVPPKPPRMYGDKRLLVKVIKANGLGPRDFGGIDPICFVLMDDPPQNHTTSAVKNSVNPFWDEHFLFDVAPSSRELHFEIYAKNKALGEDFLGQATLYVEDLRRTPSSRQILTLQGRPGTMDNVTGSLTAEFLLMEPAEADALLAGNQFTPRRRIEVDRMVTPSGTVVTTTTTTTEKPQFPHSAPNDEQWGYGPDMAMNVPTIESSPTEDTPDMSYSSSEKPLSPPEKDKKKSGFGGGFFKRFRKKRSQSADRSAHSLRESAGYLRPPEPSYGPQSKDDLELVRARQDAAASPNLKKSRSLGGSLKKLFRRSRKRSRTGGETSRESSLSRSSARHPASQGPSRDSSLTRHQPRATSVS